MSPLDTAVAFSPWWSSPATGHLAYAPYGSAEADLLGDLSGWRQVRPADLSTTFGSFYAPPIVRSFCRLIDPLIEAEEYTLALGDGSGEITDVVYVPLATITGSGTDTRTLSLTNSTSESVFASLALGAGVTAPALVPLEIPIIDDELLAVDGLTWSSSDGSDGTGGQPDPGGLLIVTINGVPA